MPTMPTPSVTDRSPMSPSTKRRLRRAACGGAIVLGAIAVGAALAALVVNGDAIRQALHPVNPTLTALVNPMLDQALPADLDRFSISGDLSTLADCEGHVTATARSRYGDALLTIGGNVQGYEHRAVSLPMTATRTANGHWTLTSAGFGPRDATPEEVQAQITVCANDLASRMGRALDKNAERNRNAAAWATTGTAQR